MSYEMGGKAEAIACAPPPPPPSLPEKIELKI